MQHTRDLAAFAVKTGTVTDCVICQDIHGKGQGSEADGGSGGLSKLCLWHSGVCTAHRNGSCCTVAANVQPTSSLELSSLCLQPLPVFMWLGLQDDAQLSDVANAYRKLSRVHHPDRGGDLVSWEITRQCHRLLKDEERLMAYTLGRNHQEVSFFTLPYLT